MRKLLSPAANSPAATDLALLISRLALGVILVAHGWQKFSTFTIAGTAASFGDMGIPAPDAAAVFVTAVEVIGGVALILGVLTPIAAVLNVITLLGALVLVHAENGVFVDQGGFELVLALFAGLAVITMLGAGRISVDALLGRTATAQ